jgi:hypothetical protein
MAAKAIKHNTTPKNFFIIFCRKSLHLNRTFYFSTPFLDRHKHTHIMSFISAREHGSKPGSAGVLSSTQANVDRKERMRQLALETIDLNKVSDICP